MRTFMLRDGDLSLTSGTYELVSGGTKLYQDMSYAMREPLGCDRFHPGWGSTLPNFIGQVSNPGTAILVQNEARRVLRNYSSIQQDRIRTDASARRRSRYGTGEVIKEITSVQARVNYDTVDVRCVLSTLSGAEVALVATVRA